MTVTKELALQEAWDEMDVEASQGAFLSRLAALCNASMESKGFNDQLAHFPTDVALMHSELSEALEAHRKDLPSEKIPGFRGIEEELADLLYRILHVSIKHRIRLEAAFFAKARYNLSRPPMHGGKKY